jgi:SpoVK/Ycf46/Vps4 family AAA+-type ATPase
LTQSVASLEDARLIARGGLLMALDVLDGVLHRAVHAASGAYGWEPGNTQFRGLYLSQADVERMLTRTPGMPPLGESVEALLRALQDSTEWNAMTNRHGLCGFEGGCLLVALAPEIDLRYERVYAYLQDDVSRKRPSVDLLLNLLCLTAEDKLERRTHFSADAPLVRGRVLHLLAEPGQTHAPLLAQTVRVDEQIVREVLGNSDLDARLRGSCECVSYAIDLSSLPLAEGIAEELRRFAFAARTRNCPLRLAFTGARMPLKQRTAGALAAALDRRLLTANLAQLQEAGEDAAGRIHMLLREAQGLNTVLYLEIDDGEEAHTRALVRALSTSEAHIVIGCNAMPAGLESVPFLVVEFAPAPFAVRRAQWQASTLAIGAALQPHELDSLAGRFRLYPDQIDAAASAAELQARWRNERPTARDFSCAARMQSGRQIGTLAQKITPRYRWHDIVLPATTADQLHSICARVVHRHRVLNEWGFDRKLSLGKGVTVLFAGASGVGKTMAAEILANELDLDLYKIDLSGVVSKYIGETEKNLERIFNAAANANAILFFDEADALFGKRSEVKDSHDRYANIEISYLLQKMEMYDGIAILATNLRQNLDDAFLRRLAYTIHFPFPEEQERLRIWQQVWPADAPLGGDLDFQFLASRFKVTGGNIRNIALAAAYIAAEFGEAISMGHLVVAVEREYQKMGKPLGRDQFLPHAAREPGRAEAQS